MSHRPFVLAATTSVLLLLAACGSSGSDGATSTTKVPVASTTTTSAPAAAKLKILVSNDDGYSAEGIATLVDGLKTLPNVEISVVAPLDQRSGTGGKSTDGELAVTKVKLADGFAGQAVDGFPADTIRVAVDDQGMKPDVVISGINLGQNLGPLVDFSGTVGAARAAVARKIPALATSQGVGKNIDYAASVPFVLAWVKEHRAAILDGTEPAAVTNLNERSCATGKVRGLAKVDADLTGSTKDALADQDCASTAALDESGGDVAAFLIGYATIDTIPNVSSR